LDRLLDGVNLAITFKISEKLAAKLNSKYLVCQSCGKAFNSALPFATPTHPGYENAVHILWEIFYSVKLQVNVPLRLEMLQIWMWIQKLVDIMLRRYKYWMRVGKFVGIRNRRGTLVFDSTRIQWKIGEFHCSTYKIMI